MKYFFTILTLLLIIQCAPQKPLASNAPEESKDISGEYDSQLSEQPLSLPELKYEWIAGQQKEYQVLLQAELSSDTIQSLRLEKFSEPDRNWFTLQIAERSLRFTDGPIKSGATVHYRLNAQIQQNRIQQNGFQENSAPQNWATLPTLTLQAPIDWVIENTLQWMPVENLGRVFLKKKAVLWISASENTQSVYLPNVISEGGEIQVRDLSEETKTPSLALHMETLQGTLRIGSIGAMGKPGEDGIGGKAGEPGEAGKNGVSQVPENKVTGFGQSRALCLVKPTDGKPGKKGGNGTNGKNGYTGGSTPKVTLHTKNHTSARVSFYSEPGHGGKGGTGGAGGAGGPGGKAGLQDFLKICPAAKDGEPGKHGEPGKNGSPGKTGQSFPIEWAI